jgi:choline transport protein
MDIDEKTRPTPITETGLVDNGEAVVNEKVGTDADRQDMFRMGKVQQMQRIFRLFPMVSFSIILMASWEIALGATVISIYNGGLAGTIYTYIVCWIGFLTVYSSMAEMGSMAPTSGGQYHWVSEFAPAAYQKVRGL